MNENELRNNLISTATQYLGWSEANGQDDLIIDKYNAIRPKGGYKMGHNDSWCAAFVSVAKHEAGLDDIIPTDCSCQDMIEKFKALGRYQEDGTITPKEADIIFYNWGDNTQPNDGWADHVGIVVSVEGNNIKVIEGNASDKVKYRDVPIAWGYIRGYGLPDYASISTATVAPESTTIGDYTGGSIVTYLSSIGKDSSYAAREKLAAEYGIAGYKGTAEQNTALLSMLRDGATPTPAPTPAPVPPTPVQPYQVGTVYTVAVNDLRVRTGAGTNYAVKTRRDLTVDGQKHADSLGRLKAGTSVQCLEMRTSGTDVWVRIPSGWIAARYQGNRFVK
jgi:hypothetical protein